MKLPHAALIIIADGQRHLVLENQGQAVAWDLQLVTSSETLLESTSDQGAERPGRYPIAGGRRTAVEQTDWKTMEKEAFSKSLASWINDQIAANSDRSVILIADPKTLGALRHGLSNAAQRAVLKEIAGDHVHRPIEEIIALLESA